jgi:glycosyltransferase involved in cell wall biosynthesis
MIRVAALTSGQNTPSSRFRVRQHIAPLKKFGVEVTELLPAMGKYAPLPGLLSKTSPTIVLPIAAVWQLAKVASRISAVIESRGADITWLERDIIPGYVTLEPFLKRPFVLDVDDAVWTHGPFGRRAYATIARRSAMVFAGNNYIADWFSKYANEVRVIPTGIDTDRFAPMNWRKDKQEGRFIIGWTGLGSNFPYLYRIESALACFLREHTFAELQILADTSPKFREIPPGKVKYIPWTPAVEAMTLSDWDVGIMPLDDNEWTRGKCSFKMLQYMATALPVVVSPVGMNREVMGMGPVGISPQTDSEWIEALEYLYSNPRIGEEMGIAGRSIVENRFAMKVVTHKIAEIFADLHH